MNDTPCRKPTGHYLIESSPQYRQSMAAKAAIEIVQRILSPLSICSAAVAGYRAELRQVLDAEAIYLGVRK